MNSNSIIVWQTNNSGGGKWKIKLTFDDSGDVAHTEFVKSIEVTDGKLYLVDYTDLTMAAQFKDHSIPAKGNESQRFEIENGNYQVKVKRFINHEDEFDESKTAFEIVFQKTDRLENLKINNIFWWTF